MSGADLYESVSTAVHRTPELQASCLSLLTWHWVNPLIKLGNRKPLQTEDLYELIPSDTACDCERLWESATTHEKVSIWTVLLQGLGKSYFIAALWKPLWLGSVLLQVFALKALVQTVENRKTNFHWRWGFLLVLTMSFASTLQSISQNNLFSSCQRISMRARAMVSMAILNKILSLKLAVLNNISHHGRMLNLLTNDTQKLVDAGSNLHFVWFSLFEIAAISSLLIIEAGIAAVPGVALVLLFQPLQVGIGWSVGKFRREAIHHTDSRIRLLGELLVGIKTVKFNGWTASFLRVIADIRNHELKWIRRALFFKFSTSTLKDGVVPLSALLIFATYAGLHRKLPASMAFSVLALLSVLVRVFNFAPAGVQYIAEALVAVQRLHRLLKASNDSSCTRIALKNQMSAVSEASVIVVDGWFSWTLPEASAKEHLEHLKSPFTEAASYEMTDQAQKVPVETIRKLKPVLKGVNLTVQKGKLIGITGAVGSGKSSFLLSLLGETECIKGSFITERPVAYVPQQPWIFNDTLRNNILFGDKHDPVKYERVLAACALDKDVLQFPAAHDTEIGERGLNLSGGQKARICLARACYSNAPLVLLDDPFSAVDIPTLNHLVQNTLHGVLRGRTIILSTHNNRVLEHCDEVYKVVNGEIHAIALVDDVQLPCRRGHLGPEDEVQNSHGLTTASAPTFSSNEEQLVADCSKASKVQLNKSKLGQSGFNNVNGVLTVKEHRVEGLVTKATYEAYLRAGGTYRFIFLMGIFIFTQLARMMISYWLAVWADEKYHLEMQVYIGSFACIVFGATLLSLIRAFAFSHATSISAKALHKKMTTSIFNSPLLFFEKNPVGRVLNRFGKDQACIDELLPMSAQNMLENLVGCLGAIALITVLIPWFLLAIPPFIVLLLYFQRQYTAVSRELKRLEGISRSPIYEHFNQTLEGITSIRAYGAEDRFHNHFAKLIDENHGAFILFLHVTRWLAFRLDFSATWCVTITSLLVVLFREHLGPGIAGVVLVQSLQLTGLFQYGIRMAADTENNFTSVERIYSYSNLPQESLVYMPRAPISNDWPSRGEIVFLNYTMAYRENLVPVLKNISFKIDSQEKVAILGRTGVGKSSLALGMFRMVDNSGCSGSILIDGVDINCIDPDVLRHRLSIIPQDPVLFKDTVRMNLDPFEQHTDSEIHEALRGSQLTTKLENLERGLETMIGENGVSFSVGESQLLCMARAILRKSKILVMDEATSAVDIDTDKAIQDVLQREFSFCTLISIAHRISTVMNCDRFLLLHNGGKMSELENPKSLSTRETEDFERVVEKLLEDFDGSPCSTTEQREHVSNLK